MDILLIKKQLHTPHSLFVQGSRDLVVRKHKRKAHDNIKLQVGAVRTQDRLE